MRLGPFCHIFQKEDSSKIGNDGLTLLKYLSS